MTAKVLPVTTRMIAAVMSSRRTYCGLGMSGATKLYTQGVCNTDPDTVAEGQSVALMRSSRVGIESRRNDAWMYGAA